MKVKVASNAARANPGDIFRMGADWYRRCPKCGRFQAIDRHQVDAQTVTVHPSLRCEIPTVGASARPCGAHYRIEGGQIQWM